MIVSLMLREFDFLRLQIISLSEHAETAKNSFMQNTNIVCNMKTYTGCPKKKVYSSFLGKKGVNVY